MAHWVELNQEGAGWDCRSTSGRVFAWGKLFVPLGATEFVGGIADVVMRSLTSQVEGLVRRPGRRLQAVSLLRSLGAAVFGAMTLEAPATE